MKLDKNLSIQAIGKFLLGVVILGLLIFLPAGSLSYWQGLLLMAILSMPLVLASPLSSTRLFRLSGKIHCSDL